MHRDPESDPESIDPEGAGLSQASEVANWALIGALAVATTLLMNARGLELDWASTIRPIGACVAILGAALFYRSLRPDERIAVTLVAVAQIIAFSAVGAIFSYAIASLDHPLWGSAFMAWDKALGLDWRAYLDDVDAHPLLVVVYRIAYQSLICQIIVAAGLLGLLGRLEDCRKTVMAIIVAGLVTIVVSGLMPAVSMFTHLGLRPEDYPRIDASGAFGPLAPFNALRAGTLRVISLANAEGLISFPSFHAALGVIFARAFWCLPWARWPGLGLNALLIAATPINGGHYFVDVIAGAGVAVLAIMAAETFARALTLRAVLRPAAADRVAAI